MYSSIIVPVIRNPLYTVAGLIFVITYSFIPHLLFPPGTSMVSPSVIGKAVFVLVAVSVFMAGIGNLLKYIIRGVAPGPGDFIEGVNLYFSRVLKVNLLILIISFLIGPFALIFRPSMMMGLSLTQILSSYNVAVIVLISPFFVLWYPAMFINNLGITDSIKKALITGKRLYPKLFLSVFVPLVPALLYLAYISLLNRGFNIFTYGYYFLFGTTFVISLFAMLYIFNIYDDVNNDPINKNL